MFMMSKPKQTYSVDHLLPREFSPRFMLQIGNIVQQPPLSIAHGIHLWLSELEDILGILILVQGP